MMPRRKFNAANPKRARDVWSAMYQAIDRACDDLTDKPRVDDVIGLLDDLGYKIVRKVAVKK